MENKTIKKESFIRRWLKSIIKDALFEERVQASTLVLANRAPGKDDSNYATGTIWAFDDKTLILREISATWEPLEP